MKVTVAVIYEDERILVVNKPAGILSIADRYDKEAPVVSDFLREESRQFFVVHRLDRDTSGTMVFAKDSETHRVLCRLFEGREVTKTYHALVWGRTAWEKTDCALPLRADGDPQHRTIVDGSGKPCLTHFVTLKRYNRVSLLAALPETGRTHQIRLHAAALGYTLLCDPLYGNGKPFFLSEVKRNYKGDTMYERPLITRTALHSRQISFTFPDTGVTIDVQADYPKDFDAVVKQLDKL